MSPYLSKWSYTLFFMIKLNAYFTPSRDGHVVSCITLSKGPTVSWPCWNFTLCDMLPHKLELSTSENAFDIFKQLSFILYKLFMLYPG